MIFFNTLYFPQHLRWDDVKFYIWDNTGYQILFACQRVGKSDTENTCLLQVFVELYYFFVYTRSIIDYNIVLQNMCSKTAKQNVDKIQNQALRLICGGMRSSPTAACEI